MVEQYLNNVQQVLGRPHAHKFLEYGGLIWRIVRHYDPPELYTTALTRPSPLDAPVMQDEIRTLLGVTTNENSFWPYPHWYEQSSRYNGEWTAANEAWFQRHLQTIECARTGGLRAGRAWQTTIHIHTAAEVADPKISGTMAHAQACCARLVREWPELWDRFNFTRLV